VPQARLYKVWNIPAYGEQENEHLQLLARVLSSGNTGRLYKRLVYQDRIATDVSASVDAREISGLFMIVASAPPGETLERIEEAIDEEVTRLLASGPTKSELDRVKAQKLAQFVRGTERIGGFGGKSDVLAMNQTYRGRPDFYKTILRYDREATPKDLQTAGRKWLNNDVYILGIHPFPEYGTTTETPDRSTVPQPGPAPEVKFPDLQRATLSNGLKIVLAERHATPLVEFSLMVDAGFVTDHLGVPGTARLAIQLLDQGTAHRTAFEISERLAALGASLGGDSRLDSSSVSLSTLTSTMDPALEIYADVIQHPAFPESDFKRERDKLLAAIQQEKVQPQYMALRVCPRLLYGLNHPYSHPLTGSGTEASVNRLTRAEMQRFHQTWFKPNHSTLIIVGDTTLKAITPKLEKLFSGWKVGTVPPKNITPVQAGQPQGIYLIDRPGSIQSVILAAQLAPPKSSPVDIPIEIMNTVLGGAFSSRVNLNLREDKHWAYGAGTFIAGTQIQRPYIAFAPVQADKTKESMIELDKEFRGILGPRPVTQAELTKAQKSRTLELAGTWETLAAVSQSIREIIRYGLPDDYYKTYPDRIRALTLEDTANAAKSAIHPDQLVWVVVGDRAKIELGLRELGWGTVHLLDPDGNPAGQSVQ
jgi:zinc protease